jgi:hypothetical protein
MYVSAQTFIELDPNTLTGTGQGVVTSIVGGVSNIQTISIDVKVVSCPKLTPEDRKNIDQKNKMLSRMDRL